MTVDLLIDGRPLWDASSYRGIGVYLRSLLPHLGAADELAVTVLATDGVALPEGVRRARVSRAIHGRCATQEHELRRRLELQRFHHDVLHSPALDPLRRSRRPWVQTLHDMILLAFDHPDFRRDRARWIKRVAPVIARADAVIAVSQHVADDAARLMDVDPGRIFVAPHGVDRRFRPPERRVPSDPPYVLYCGEFDPRKGYAEAFELAARLADAGLPHRLKVAGRIVPWTEDHISALVKASRRQDRIELLGHVAHDRMPELYASASALLVTSRYEGFGLPALESMAVGTPVVAFSNSAITEVVRDGGVLVRDGDVEALSREAISVVTDDARWRALSASGIERAREFTWSRSAQVHVEAYRTASRALTSAR